MESDFQLINSLSTLFSGIHHATITIKQIISSCAIACMEEERERAKNWYIKSNHLNWFDNLFGLQWAEHEFMASFEDGDS